MRVRSIDELNALPTGSAIVSVHGTVHVCYEKGQERVWLGSESGSSAFPLSAEALADGSIYSVINIPGRNMLNEAKADALDEAANRTEVGHVKEWLSKRAGFYRNPKLIVAQSKDRVQSSAKGY